MGGNPELASGMDDPWPDLIEAHGSLPKLLDSLWGFTDHPARAQERWDFITWVVDKDFDLQPKPRIEEASQE